MESSHNLIVDDPAAPPYIPPPPPPPPYSVPNCGALPPPWPLPHGTMVPGLPVDQQQQEQQPWPQQQQEPQQPHLWNYNFPWPQQLQQPHPWNFNIPWQPVQPYGYVMVGHQQLQMQQEIHLLRQQQQCQMHMLEQLGRKTQYASPPELRKPQAKGPRCRQESTPGSSSQGLEGQYNLPDFVTTYEDAKFLVIKSFSEEDVYKSIKYGCWASTARGNQRLDAAYREAQVKLEGMPPGSSCPVFLLFSVNSSGQFCGVGEMSGPVEFDKCMDFWQQNKTWKGFIPVKWHLVKDVPNKLFRHILLDNSDKDPVTYSRDAQVVKLKQGNQMLAIFKSYSYRTSLLDDFEYYEGRQNEKTTKLRSKGGHATAPAAAAPAAVPSSDAPAVAAAPALDSGGSCGSSTRTAASTATTAASTAAVDTAVAAKEDLKDHVAEVFALLGLTMS